MLGKIGKKAPGSINTKTLGGILAAACAGRLCRPGMGNISRTFADAECMSVMNELINNRPELAGILQGAAGLAQIIGECSENCMNTVNDPKFQKQCSGTACLVDRKNGGV